ncbi:hypothetical protein O6151_23715, partial [Salmonella enterica subsp. enterica]
PLLLLRTCVWGSGDPGWPVLPEPGDGKVGKDGIGPAGGGGVLRVGARSGCLWSALLLDRDGSARGFLPARFCLAVSFLCPSS